MAAGTVHGARAQVELLQGWITYLGTQDLTVAGIVLETQTRRPSPATARLEGAAGEREHERRHEESDADCVDGWGKGGGNGLTLDECQGISEFCSPGEHARLGEGEVEGEVGGHAYMLSGDGLRQFASWSMNTLP